MSQSEHDKQTEIIKRLTASGGGGHRNITPSGAIKLFSIGSAVGAIIGVILAAQFLGAGSGAAVAIISAVISGLFTIFGAVIQSRGR